METLFQIFIVECSRIVLQLRELPIAQEQMSLFEEFAEIHLVFNGYNLLHRYKEFLWNRFVQFKESFAQSGLAYSHAELQHMLLGIKECELSYYRLELENRKIWQHYNAFLPFDANVSDFQKKRILCKISEFLLVQKHYLQLLRIFIRNQLEASPHTPVNKPPAPKGSVLDYDLLWIGNKSDLVEMNVVLFESGMVTSRNRKLSLHAFQRIIGEIFHIDLSDYSVVMSNMYKRKKSYSVFFPKMMEVMNEYVAKH